MMEDEAVLDSWIVRVHVHVDCILLDNLEKDMLNVGLWRDGATKDGSSALEV